MSETIEILQALRSDRDKIDRAASELAKRSQELDGGIDLDTGEIVRGLRDRIEEVTDNELIAYEEEALGRGERLPAQDIRAAHVNRRVRAKHGELRDRFLAVEAHVLMLQRLIANRKAAIGAAQSILRGERE